jgi:hypothetical protein
MKLYSPDPPAPPPGPYPSCDCFAGAGPRGQRVPSLHNDVQDTSCDAWIRLLAVIDRAVVDAATELSPLDGFSSADRARVVTLPSSIGRLKSVRKLKLYGSHLSRIPHEIGEMASLEYLDVYTSNRLHYLPYELTRCARLRDSRMSTRALFGNYKNRGKFPDLLASDSISTVVQLRPALCSVCAAEPPRLDRWLTLGVGTDWVPLLVAACSQECIQQLPTPPGGYVPCPHTGGSINQPPAEW